MVSIKFDNSKMIHSCGNKTVVTEWHGGTIELFENCREIACYDFGNLSLDDYQCLISDFFPGQEVRYE